MSKSLREFFVYMLRCNDNSLYTGYTVDITQRIKVHQDGKGAKYTLTRRPVTLVYYETLASKSDAMRREASIKKLDKKEKEQLIISPLNEFKNPKRL